MSRKTASGSEPDADYFRICASEERASAARAGDPSAAAAHAELATQYEELARILDDSGRLARIAARDFRLLTRDPSTGQRQST